MGARKFMTTPDADLTPQLHVLHKPPLSLRGAMCCVTVAASGEGQQARSATEPEERHVVASLGTLERDKSTRYVLDLSLPKRPDGKFRIADIEVTYDVGTGKRESTGPVPLEVTYTAAGQGYINAEVAKHIDEVQIYELNKNLQQAIATNDKAEVERVARNIEKKGEVMGPRAAKKTMLARQVLTELNAGGRVSKKTQLAMEDSARMAEEMPQ